ncbi:cysteine--tRNA ligase [Agaribacterium haliotis]|uniref:cysteine--tRNA ligase n=1 Tax=Agaribacterium haliotis TaxID=2013869 RepID=UPI000BB567B0|nr:cysteine--tRNA ligase [Agaribacterium haliotis]
MQFTIYNTAKREKEPFTPLNPESVKMYVCGPTVYNLVHIGNARPAVVFDVLKRVLDTLYPEVVYARNITDIDDKIMKAAAESGRSIDSIANEYTDAYVADMAALNVQQPTLAPKATDHIQAMLNMVQKLVDQGHAYAAEGHVLFDVRSMDDYGKLSNRSLEDMLEGARVEVAPYKKYGGDFVLWKPSSEEEPGWDSPWGRGRPGWHLECSAMIAEHLGESIDIHGGGRDLIFPHHENERAQSQCAHGGKQFVQYWMHNGYINIDGEKMSKSLGNFRTVRGLLEQYHGEVIRYALLSAHYRSELDFSVSLLDQSKASLDGIYTALRASAALPAVEVDIKTSPAYAALLDDLNSAMAISELHALAKELNRDGENAKPETRAMLLELGKLLGLLTVDAETWFKGEASDEDAEINALVKERDEAKAAKNWGRADEIRDELKERGIILEDSKDGASWRRA